MKFSANNDINFAVVKFNDIGLSTNHGSKSGRILG